MRKLDPRDRRRGSTPSAPGRCRHTQVNSPPLRGDAPVASDPRRSDTEQDEFLTPYARNDRERKLSAKPGVVGQVNPQERMFFLHSGGGEITEIDWLEAGFRR